MLIEVASLIAVDTFTDEVYTVAVLKWFRRMKRYEEISESPLLSA